MLPLPAVFSTSTGTITSNTGGGNLLLNVIAAAVIGGTSLNGGKGSIWLTLIGVLIIGYLDKILSINAVGEDSYGAETIANFERFGIDTAYVRREPGSSGVAPIWVEPDGSNRIIIVPGANAGLLPEHGAAAVRGRERVELGFRQRGRCHWGRGAGRLRRARRRRRRGRRGRRRARGHELLARVLELEVQETQLEPEHRLASLRAADGRLHRDQLSRPGHARRR